MVSFPENLFFIFKCVLFLDKQSKVDVLAMRFLFVMLGFFSLHTLTLCALPAHILFLFGTETLLHNFSKIQ